MGSYVRQKEESDNDGGSCFFNTVLNGFLHFKMFLKAASIHLINGYFFDGGLG